MMIEKGLNIQLNDPGLVENSASAEQCVHACFQMIFRTKNSVAVPSFDELDHLMNKRPGKYTYEFALLAKLPSMGFDTRIIWNLDLARISSDPASFFLEHYGHEVGTETIRNTDLNQVSRDALTLLHAHGVNIEHRPAKQEDLISLMLEGFFLMCTVNQRVLQADPGYVAHSIVVFGCSSRGVTIHNPGPPSVSRAEVAWDLFDRAWAFPNAAARNILAFRPRT